MKVPAPSLAPILRSDTQGRILARLFVHPRGAYNHSELVRCVRSSMPTVQREVDRGTLAVVLLDENDEGIAAALRRPAHPSQVPA